MKRLLPTLLLLFAPTFLFAQFSVNGLKLYHNSGNVGIGTSNPFSKLSFGTSNANFNSRIAFYEHDSDGTRFRGIGMANPSGAYYGVGIWAGSGTYAPTNNNMRMFIGDDGKIGIGTDAPGGLLDVRGHIKLGDVKDSYLGVNSLNNYIPYTSSYHSVLNSGNTLYFNIDANNNDTNRAFIFAADRNGESGGLELMRIAESGYVGIGTSTPSNTLHVKSTAPGISIERNGDVTWETRIDNNGRFIVENATSSLEPIKIEKLAPTGSFYLDNSGQLGLGTSNPEERLQIGEANGLTYHDGGHKAFTWNGYYESGSWKYLGSEMAAQLEMDYSGQSFQLNMASSGTTDNNIGWTNALTAKSNGYLGIGTENPTNKLHISNGSLLVDAFHGGNETGIFFRQGFDYGDRKYNVSILAYDHNAGGSSPDGLSINGVDGVSFSTGSDDRNERMRIAQDGNVGIGTTSPYYKLTVNTDNENHFRMENGSEAAFIKLRDDGNLNIWAHGNDDLIFSRGTGAGTESMRISSDGNLGIGTTSPQKKLSILDGTNDAKLRLGYNDSFYMDYGNTNITMNRVSNSQGVFTIETTGSYASDGGHIVLNPADGRNVGIGVNNPGNKLEVNGTIRSKRVKVEVDGWPDYVFSENYELRDLMQLESYIKTNKHLPDVPSAKEVEEKGLDLGNMDATLLKKVEELTLYLIDMKKEIQELKKENADLKEKIK